MPQVDKASLKAGDFLSPPTPMPEHEGLSSGDIRFLRKAPDLPFGQQTLGSWCSVPRGGEPVQWTDFWLSLCLSSVSGWFFQVFLSWLCLPLCAHYMGLSLPTASVTTAPSAFNCPEICCNILPTEVISPIIFIVVGLLSL